MKTHQQHQIELQSARCAEGRHRYVQSTPKGPLVCACGSTPPVDEAGNIVLRHGSSCTWANPEAQRVKS